MNKQTQLNFIINQLNLNGYISRNLCLQERITRLGARIQDLKDSGWEFETKYVHENGGKNFYYYTKSSPYKKVVYNVEGIGEIIKYEK